MEVRTRFAPSPTGSLHIGGARTALFNWLYARQQRGKYLLRIEDTDRQRSTEEYTQDIFTSLSWLGIDADIKPIFQSTRIDRHQQVIQQLLDAGSAYYCSCTKERLDALRQAQTKNKQKPRYDGFCRDSNREPSSGSRPVVRFKTPLDGKIVIEDQVQGRVVVHNNELDDLILARSDGTPTYHLSVVVDDIDCATTHIIRGDDHLNNTSRQINIIKALGKEIPSYAHIPLIHGKDGKRMSKRHGAVSVRKYKEDGILPHALLNYLARLGWSHGDQEIFTVEQMIDLFSLHAIHKSAATFDREKLVWVNHQHMKAMPGSQASGMLEELFAATEIIPDEKPKLAELYDVQKERCKTLQEITEVSKYFYIEIDHYDEKAVKKYFTEDNLVILQSLKDRLAVIEHWSADGIHAEVKAVADHLDLKLGKVASPLRLAVTGQMVSPPIDITLELLGSVKSLHRIDQAIEYIASTVVM